MSEEMKECPHFDQIRVVEPSTTEGCTDCLKTGDQWHNLRMCRYCGYVGCCDKSKNKHMTKHFETTKHPIMQSREPNENWMWCYLCNIGWTIEYFDLD